MIQDHTHGRFDAIAVVDFGGQYAHLIATKVRRQHVRADILQPEDPIERFAGYKGVILSGSPALSSHDEDSAYQKGIYALDVPILGLCFGHQEMAKHYGGEVIHGGREWGHANLHIMREHPLFEGLDEVEQVWMSHFDSVSALGPDFEELAYSELGEGEGEHRYAAIGSDKLKRYGFQFHAEVDDTRHGEQMLRNYVINICGCEPSWTMERFVEEQLVAIREQVGERSVFLLASGGVDSTVAAKLFAQALPPDRLMLLHVDNGLMRKNESEKVLALLRAQGLGENLHFIDATDDFLNALGDEVEPEAKRKSIGETFIAVFDQEARRLGAENHLLGQGTIYPDTIESGGTKRAHTIKTHHNRIPLVEEMIAAGRVVEPLAELYKVEVRELGETLGLPRTGLWRHPFPGPGLGVRLLCSEGKEAPDVDAIQTQAAPIALKHNLTATVMPVRSVGVKADVRSYERPVMLSGALPFKELLEASGELLKQVEGLNRCVWNVGSKEAPTLRPKRATMTRERLNILREADAAVMHTLRMNDLYDSIWQCPIVLVPVAVDAQEQELCVVRPVLSERAMTAVAAELPETVLMELRETVLAIKGIGALGLDLTSKPPGTIEWE
ncbi:MAG: glutamine-hydrolyzing GMP synthase [Deltaproteobacteria bacterium]|nr:glutamine-hydrolyzing GMP synthase [Deltaproteobacteria bacterium]